MEEKETASGPDATGVADVRAPAEPEGAEQPPVAGVPVEPVGVAAAPRSHGPAPAGRRRLPRLGSVLRRRRPFLEEDRVDPESVPVDGAEDPAVAAVVVESPVLTGFLLAVGVALAIGVVSVLRTNGQLIVWIAAALFIALGLDPLVRRVEAWGAPRWVGVLTAALGLAAVAGAFVALLVPTVIEQSTQLVQDLPAIIDGVMRAEWFVQLDEEFHLQEAVRAQTERLAADGVAVTDLFGGLLGLGQTVLNAVFSVLVVVVLTLYFLSSLPHMKYWAYRLAPRSRRPRIEALSEQITSSVGHYVMGQSFVAALNGAVAFTALAIAGAPFAVLLAAIAAFMAFIPLVGAAIGGTLLTLVSLLTSWQTAAVFAAVYFVYLQIEAYVISPRVMARAVSVPAAVAVIAVIAGGALLGVLGALLAIPLAAALLLLVREVFIPRQDAR
ncbi:AI-2E family transporter [Micrococcus luteus]|uniref:AI-2E family transporter n=1 Tax=Micrococcus luteus TaxID=1270 RepID=A0AAX0VNX0_MICLU|nr:AI-2E family transporter [Micrococcus luteus]MCV7477720.1 AI-2E family transporter [Micrococcus luteus]MCV7635033.1 AI-2E family transporter [Micrococcus luteus]MCV7699799.1 AI-2E family transporter [Micrococcus luteus]MCV7701866.1 AI-2E family transporter [Micrococcus luteus]MCV7713271.1 AI-2E family transporter [Micrococcus luteus]